MKGDGIHVIYHKFDHILRIQRLLCVIAGFYYGIVLFPTSFRLCSAVSRLTTSLIIILSKDLSLKPFSAWSCARSVQPFVFMFSYSNWNVTQRARAASQYQPSSNGGSTSSASKDYEVEAVVFPRSSSSYIFLFVCYFVVVIVIIFVVVTLFGHTFIENESAIWVDKQTTFVWIYPVECLDVLAHRIRAKQFHRIYL